MKMTFRGWGREVRSHTHVVVPVQDAGSGFKPQRTGEPLKWSGPFRALGKVSDLGLSGSFLVEITFEEEEIGNWLAEYVKAHPSNALRILARAQAEAIIALGSERGATPAA